MKGRLAVASSERTTLVMACQRSRMLLQARVVARRSARSFVQKTSGNLAGRRLLALHDRKQVFEAAIRDLAKVECAGIEHPERQQA